VRALTEVGWLSVADARSVTLALDDPAVPLAAVAAFLAGRGWRVRADSPARAELASILATIGSLDRIPVADPAVVAGLLAPYADAVEKLAAAEIAGLPVEGGRDAVVERVVAGRS
jgi:TPP-dependent trihydroxycyclohexane-1,2-dione (THcHDO) dehydratase